MDTWALGKLERRQDKTFKWTVTAVRAGPYRISYAVAAGLNGKAKAGRRERRPAHRASSRGTISDTPPQTRVADDGKTIVSGTR